MHEAILTRGMVEGLPFQDRVQIYVPENCVLLHEGACHLEAQHGEAGLRKCIVQLRAFNGSLLEAWLSYMNSISNNAFREREYLLAEIP